MLILGIETSCDETSVSLVADGRRVLASVVASQIDLHRKYGGVVPELASRAHLEWLVPVLTEALGRAEVSMADIDAVAVTNTPGLIGSLLIGLTAAKTLAWYLGRPLIGVNHIHAHAYAVCLDTEIDPWPSVALVVSGGHTTLFDYRSPLQLQRVGRTVDDAAGEAFDKVAAILDLPYPGGPSIDRVSRQGNRRAIHFKRTRMGAEGLDFSFSGIKTGVLYHVRGQDMARTSANLTDQQKADVAASFQEAMVDMLTSATLRAAEKLSAASIVMGGGVAANSRLRERMQTLAEKRGLACHISPMKYCTDNAAMVAGLGYHLLNAGQVADLHLDATV